jgi:hypothetical protein
MHLGAFFRPVFACIKYFHKAENSDIISYLIYKKGALNAILSYCFNKVISTFLQQRCFLSKKTVILAQMEIRKL